MDNESGYCDSDCELEGEFIAQYGERVYKEQLEADDELDMYD